MSNDAYDDFDFAAALATPRRAGQTLRGRRELDRAKLSVTDRRRIQTTGRTEQFNLRVRPEMKSEVLKAAETLNLMPTEIFEKAWEHYKATVLTVSTRKAKQ